MKSSLLCSIHENYTHDPSLNSNNQSWGWIWILVLTTFLLWYSIDILISKSIKKVFDCNIWIHLKARAYITQKGSFLQIDLPCQDMGWQVHHSYRCGQYYPDIAVPPKAFYSQIKAYIASCVFKVFDVMLWNNTFFSVNVILTTIGVNLWCIEWLMRGHFYVHCKIWIKAKITFIIACLKLQFIFDENFVTKRERKGIFYPHLFFF